MGRFLGPQYIYIYVLMHIFVYMHMHYDFIIIITRIIIIISIYSIYTRNECVLPILCQLPPALNQQLDSFGGDPRFHDQTGGVQARSHDFDVPRHVDRVPLGAALVDRLGELVHLGVGNGSEEQPMVSGEHPPRVAFPFEPAVLKGVSHFGYKWKNHHWVLQFFDSNATKKKTKNTKPPEYMVLS